MTANTYASRQAILDRFALPAQDTEPAKTPWAKAIAVRNALANNPADSDAFLDELERTIEQTPPAREVTKLPEVHDPAGDDLKFHIPAGRALQVLGSREIDISRIPDTQNVIVTDSKGRALPTRSAVAREKAVLEALTRDEALGKLMRKYGGKHFSFTMSR